MFYVAITRARRRVFVLSDGGLPSPFVLELIDGGYDITVFGRLPENDVPCPRCIRGCLERRENARSGGTFYGCSNWPYCDYRQSSCPACRTGITGQGGRHLPLPRLRPSHRGLPQMRWLAATQDQQVRPVPGVLELARLRLHPEHPKRKGTDCNIEPILFHALSDVASNPRASIECVNLHCR